jgi:hypothetical protein
MSKVVQPESPAGHNLASSQPRGKRLRRCILRTLQLPGVESPDAVSVLSQSVPRIFIDGFPTHTKGAHGRSALYSRGTGS